MRIPLLALMRVASQGVGQPGAATLLYAPAEPVFGEFLFDVPFTTPMVSDFSFDVTTTTTAEPTDAAPARATKENDTATTENKTATPTPAPSCPPGLGYYD